MAAAENNEYSSTNNRLWKQQLKVQMLRQGQPISQSNLAPAMPPAPKYTYSSQSGPLRLQKQMQDAGL